MEKFWEYLQQKLGVADIKEMLKMAEIDRSALVKTLVEIGESGNKIASKIDRLVQAQQEGAQNEVSRLVQELAPTADFLRGLAADPTPEAVENGNVVPPLPPVGGEVAPQEDVTTQEAVSQAESGSV